MKFYQVVLTVIVALAINNFVLFKYANNLSDEPQINSAVVPSPEATQTYHLEAPAALQPSTSLTKQEATAPEPADEIEPIDSPTEYQIVINAMQVYTQSQEFTNALDEYYMGAGARFEEIGQRLNGLSASELFSIATESENALERQSSMQSLMQNKLHELTAAELRTLYQTDTTMNWNKASILTPLLEQNDPQALSWAKELITSSNFQTHIESGLYSAIHQSDPDFMSRYLSDYDFKGRSNDYGFYGFLREEPKLSNQFFSERLDEILDLKNSTLFRFGGHDVEVEMTNSQQSKLLSFFESNNQRKRSFAMSMLGNIDDIDMLRETYSKLDRTRDKRNFLNTLRTDKNAAKKTLGSELAASSEDPDLQRLFN